MELSKRFRNDADVAAVFGAHANSTLQYVSPQTAHASAVERLVGPQSNVFPHVSSLTVEHAVLSETDARRAAQDVRDTSLHARTRESAPNKHLVTICDGGNRQERNERGDETARENTTLSACIREYATPVAYRLLGQVVECNSRGEKQFLVKSVWETHIFARITGHLMQYENNRFSEQDASVIDAVERLQGKKGERDGDPLPIAEFFARLAMQKRGVNNVLSMHDRDQLPRDIADLLSADEFETDIDVKECPHEMPRIAQTLRHGNVANALEIENQNSSSIRAAVSGASTLENVANSNKNVDADEENDDENDDEIVITFRNKK